MIRPPYKRRLDPSLDLRPHVHHYATTKHWIDSHIARVFIGIIVLINATNLGLLTFFKAGDAWHPWLVIIDYVTISIFVMEMILRFMAHHRHFFHHPWNVFDFTIVALSLIPLSTSIPMLEGIRVLRLLYFVEFSKNLKHILFGLYYAFPGFLSVSFLILIIFYVYAIVGVSLFQHPDVPMFQNIITTFHGLFRVLTMDGWYDILTKTEVIFPKAWIYFYSYFLVMVMTTLNLFVGVVVTALQSAEEDIELPRKNAQRDWMNQLSHDLRVIQNTLDEIKSEKMGASKTPKKSDTPPVK